MLLPVNFGLLFSPKDRGLLEEAHAPITKSYHHRQSRKSPDWVQEMTLYAVFVRNFSKDGNLKSVMRDLPGLYDLGIKAIWLMPFHPIGKPGQKGRRGSPYSIQDYFAIHPDLGSSDDFRALVESVHKLDMKIFIDLVANHCANDHIEMQNHPDWFQRDRHGNFTRRIPDWLDVTDLNYDNPELRAYMKKIILHWVREFDIDGYRCDVAGLVPPEFWQQVRNDLERIKSDIILLAEGDHPEMHLHAFDVTYDWDLYYTMEDMKNGEIHAEKALAIILKSEKLFPQNALRLRFMENHDLPRSIKLFQNPAYKPYATLIFTLPGIPLIYNGQEIGCTKRPNLFEKDPINWQQPDAQVFNWYKNLIHLRQKHSQFSIGKIVKIHTNQAKDVIAFARVNDKKVGVVLLNFSHKKLPTTLQIPQGFPSQSHHI